MRSIPGASLGRAATRLGLAAVGILLGLGALELGLRLTWCSSSAATYEYQSGPYLSANPYLGTWHFPNNDVEHRRSCFDAHYRTNEWGMKGEPVRVGARRIALLGDSFVEGFGHDNDTIAAHFLEQKLGADFQVLNFGVSFFHSTPDELVMYDNFAKFFDPEVVILFFLNYNDLEDVHNADKARWFDRDLHWVYPRVASLDQIASVVKNEPIAGRIERKESRFCVVRFLQFAGYAIAQKAQMVLDFRWDFHHELARPYLVREDDAMQRSWAIVDASLARLRDLTREHGAELVVVSIADPYQIDDQWVRLNALREDVPMSASHPNERLAGICAKLGIRHQDLLPDTRAYVREHHLRFPLLSFACDRHYDDEGQKLMAELVYGYLKREGLLDRRAAKKP